MSEDMKCPECDGDIQGTEEECPHCGFDLSEWDEGEKRVEKLLSKVDDTTYQVNEDPDSLIEDIKKFAPKKEVKAEETLSEDETMTYECPLCGCEVKEDASRCQGCGAIFEDD